MEAICSQFRAQAARVVRRAAIAAEEAQKRAVVLDAGVELRLEAADGDKGLALRGGDDAVRRVLPAILLTLAHLLLD